MVVALRTRVADLERQLRHERKERIQMEEGLSAAYNNLIKEVRPPPFDYHLHEELSLRRAPACVRMWLHSLPVQYHRVLPPSIPQR